jgi:hypothetical protein
MEFFPGILNFGALMNRVLVLIIALFNRRLTSKEALQIYLFFPYKETFLHDLCLLVHSQTILHTVHILLFIKQLDNRRIIE